MPDLDIEQHILNILIENNIIEFNLTTRNSRCNYCLTEMSLSEFIRHMDSIQYSTDIQDVRNIHDAIENNIVHLHDSDSAMNTNTHTETRSLPVDNTWKTELDRLFDQSHIPPSATQENIPKTPTVERYDCILCDATTTIDNDDRQSFTNLTESEILRHLYSKRHVETMTDLKTCDICFFLIKPHHFRKCPTCRNEICIKCFFTLISSSTQNPKCPFCRTCIASFPTHIDEDHNEEDTILNMLYQQLRLNYIYSSTLHSSIMSDLQPSLMEPPRTPRHRDHAHANVMNAYNYTQRNQSESRSRHGSDTYDPDRNNNLHDDTDTESEEGYDMDPESYNHSDTDNDTMSDTYSYYESMTDAHADEWQLDSSSTPSVSTYTYMDMDTERTQTSNMNSVYMYPDLNRYRIQDINYVNILPQIDYIYSSLQSSSVQQLMDTTQTDILIWYVLLYHQYRQSSFRTSNTPQPDTNTELYTAYILRRIINNIRTLDGDDDPEDMDFEFRSQ